MTRAALFTVALAMIASLGSNPAPAGRPHDIEPVSFGIFDGAIAELKLLGASWTRVGMHWGRVQPTPDTYEWSDVGARILPASHSNIRPIVAIHAVSPWGSYCRGLSGVRASKLSAFRAFIRTAAERYDGDGVGDVPGLGPTPVNVWQVENQWTTATFFRDSSNCPVPGQRHAGQAREGGARYLPPEATGDPVRAAEEYIAEYDAVAEAVHAADPDALVGPGNIPALGVDTALFCEGKLGDRYIRHILKADGSVAKTLRLSKGQVCDKTGPNPYGMKWWVRYGNVVLQRVMPRIRDIVDYIDAAQYGRYQDVQLRNEWLVEKTEEWGSGQPPPLVAWETGGPDWRTTLPSPDWRRAVADDLPKRLALSFATGSKSVAWFHNHFNVKASVGLRQISLLDERGAKLPAYWNHRLFARFIAGASGATLERRGSVKPGAGAYIVRFQLAGGHEAVVAWADKGRKVSLHVDHRTVRVIAFAGKERPPAARMAARRNVMTLYLTAQPSLILD